jgi:predicted RNase H-like HicB family nuclease
MMKKYAVIFEKSNNGWGAFVPDLPGCVALGFTLEETKKLIREALEQHLAAMRADGEMIPEPSYVEMVEVA